MKHRFPAIFRKGCLRLLLPALFPAAALCAPEAAAMPASLPQTAAQADIRQNGRDERDEQIAALTQQVEALKKTVEVLKQSVEALQKSVESLERGTAAPSYASGAKGYAAGQGMSSTATPSAGEESIPDNALVQSPATYPGGAAALLRFVSENIIYPAEALQNDVQGIVVLRFVVQKDGTVGNVQVTKSLTPETDREAERVVKSLKKFLPARQDGRPVAVWFTLPIRLQFQ